MKKTLLSIILAFSLLLSPVAMSTGIGHDQGFHQGCDHDKDKKPKKDKKDDKDHDDDNAPKDPKPPKPPKDYNDHPKPIPSPGPKPNPTPSPTGGHISNITTSTSNYNSSNTNTNGATSTSSVGSSGNSSVQVTQGDVTVNPGSVSVGGSTNVDNSRTIFVPSHVTNPVQASQLAAGNIIKDSSVCGPLQQVVSTPITGTKFGWFSDTQVFLGYQYTLAPFYDKDGNQRTFKVVDGQKIGHQVIMFNTTLGVSGSSGVSLGGNGTGGGGGSGSASGSSAMQSQATQIQLRECILEEKQVAQPTVQVIKETVYVQQEAIKKAPVKKPRKVVTKPIYDCRTICAN